jgi:hypothetical protein
MLVNKINTLHQIVISIISIVITTPKLLLYEIVEITIQARLKNRIAKISHLALKAHGAMTLEFSNQYYCN